MSSFLYNLIENIMNIYITRISKKIRNMREEKKLTQEELAEQLGISRQSIISVEKGKCLPSLPLAMRIANIFNFNFDEIFNPDKYKKKGGEIMTHTLMPWSPFGDLDRFFEEDDSWRLPKTKALQFPMVNVKQSEKEITITADIPGIKEEDISIEVSDNFVDISGERKEETKKEEEGYFHQEFRYGSFARRIPLPAEVKANKAEAVIKNGQLQIIIPKIQAEKPKVTKVKVKKL